MRAMRAARVGHRRVIARVRPWHNAGRRLLCLTCHSSHAAPPVRHPESSSLCACAQPWRVRRRADTRPGERRIAAPIEYQGRMLDSNARAQSNISNKINEINARIQTGQAMPESLMMWLDANNQVVTFDSQEQMRDWLQGLVIAITQRGTEAYAWSWQVKDQLRALESKDAIETFSW